MPQIHPNPYPQEIGEELRGEFEKEYGKNKKTGYGQWLDLTRLPSGSYRSMATYYAWVGFRHGRGLIEPNQVDEKGEYIPHGRRFIKS